MLLLLNTFLGFSLVANLDWSISSNNYEITIGGD